MPFLKKKKISHHLTQQYSQLSDEHIWSGTYQQKAGEKSNRLLGSVRQIYKSVMKIIAAKRC